MYAEVKWGVQGYGRSGICKLMKSTQLLTLKSVLGSAVCSQQSRIFSAGDPAPALENPQQRFSVACIR